MAIACYSHRWLKRRVLLCLSMKYHEFCCVEAMALYWGHVLQLMIGNRSGHIWNSKIQCRAAENDGGYAHARLGRTWCRKATWRSTNHGMPWGFGLEAVITPMSTIRLGFSTVCVADLWQTVQKKRTLVPGHLEPILRSCLGKACK